MSTHNTDRNLDSDLDVERGPQKLMHNTLALPSALQDLQVELRGFVDEHIQKLLSLRASLLLLNSQPPLAQSAKSTSGNIQSIEPSLTVNIYEKPSHESHATGVHMHGALDNHAHHLHDFLRSQIQSALLLQDALLNPNKTRPSPEELVNEEGARSFQSLSEQFSMQVVISTFTASLIVSYVAFVKDPVLVSHPLAFNVGMLLSFFAMTVHLGNTILAGRGAALASESTTCRVEDEEQNLKYFRRYLRLCEQLQFIATITFLVAVVVLSFFIFDKIVFPVVLLLVCVMLTLIVFLSVYWRVSMTLRNLELVVKGTRVLLTKMNSYWRSGTPL